MPIIEEATCMKIGFKEEDGAREWAFGLQIGWGKGTIGIRKGSLLWLQEHAGIC